MFGPFDPELRGAEAARGEKQNACCVPTCTPKPFCIEGIQGQTLGFSARRPARARVWAAAVAAAMGAATRRQNRMWCFMPPAAFVRGHMRACPCARGWACAAALGARARVCTNGLPGLAGDPASLGAICQHWRSVTRKGRGADLECDRHPLSGGVVTAGRVRLNKLPLPAVSHMAAARRCLPQFHTYLTRTLASS